MVENHTTDGGLHCWRLYLRYQPRGTEGPCGPVAQCSLVSEKQEDPQQRPWVHTCVCWGGGGAEVGGAKASRSALQKGENLQ